MRGRVCWLLLSRFIFQHSHADNIVFHFDNYVTGSIDHKGYCT